MRALVVVAALLAPVSADAKVLTLFGEVHGGGLYGKGLSGDPVAGDADFFSNAPHGMYGVRVGARFLILEGAIQHHQFFNGDRVATWTQLGAGMAVTSDLGDDKERKSGHSAYVELGALLGFGLGTGAQVTPPLSNDEITDKGFVAEGRLGFGKHLNALMDIGVAVPISWAYLLKSDFDTTANDLTTHYRSLQVEALVYVRLNIQLL